MRLRALATALTVAALASCSDAAQPTGDNASGPEHLSARPQSNVTTAAPGTYRLFVATSKDARVTIPASASAAAAIPLVVMLHGLGANEEPLEEVIAFGEQMGFAVLTPYSRAQTWDLALGAFGNDVVLLNKALEETFKKVKVDAARIALAGVSDGASYALSLGVANGDLFTHLIAFAPGFLDDDVRRGKPAIFIAHARDDVVLSFQNTSTSIVPSLRALGYSVRFDPFDGNAHFNPAEADSAFHWFLR